MSPNFRNPALATLVSVAALVGFANDEPPVELNPSPRLATPDVLPASDEAMLALKRFQLPPGFQATLWAAEPMLANPVAFNFDERGRIFVAETYRYGSSVLDIRNYLHMLEEDLAARTIEDREALIRNQFGEKGAAELAIEGEVVRLLEDRDGDGVADHSSIYADGFNSMLDGVGSGVLIRDGKVWFANIPSLWQFTGKDRAETRTELARGFGVHFNYTGHDLHGLTFGPDGKIYYTIGDRGTHLTNKEGKLISEPDTGAVFRSNPDGTELEIVHTGLRNPQSLLFTENGDLFTGDNDSDQGDQERLVQIVDGGDSGWRIGYQFNPLTKAGPWNTERMWHPRNEGQPAFMLAPIANIEDGPSGIAYYPGTGLAPGYEQNIFITHFKGAISRSGIHSYKLSPAGASYTVSDSRPFLYSALPTDVRFGPDGKLYYSDWAEGWPKSKRGRIYAIFHPDHVHDPLVLETKRLISEGLKNRRFPELARLLGHADYRVRLEAQFTLAERGVPGLSTFAQVAKASEQPLARLHAIWGLGQLAKNNLATIEQTLLPLLNDPDAEVRAQAAKVLGNSGVTSATPALIAALKDDSNRVRFFAAQSLGKLRATDAVPALLEALRVNADQDQYLRHALVMGLVGANQPDALLATARDESRAIRLGAVLALRRLEHAGITAFLQDSDSFIVSETARAINDQPINAALPALAALITTPISDDLVMTRVINANFRLGLPKNAVALITYAARADVAPALRAEALAQIANWPKPPARDRVVGNFRPVANPQRDVSVVSTEFQKVLANLFAPETPASAQTAAFAAIQSLDLRSTADELFAIVNDAEKPGTTRAAALTVLDSFADPRIPEAARVAGASSDAKLRLAALPIASQLSPEAALPVLKSLLELGSIEEQRAALTSLAKLDHSEAATLIATKVTALDQVRPAIQLDVLTAAEARTEPILKTLLADRETRLAADPNPLAAFEPTLLGGNARRGADVFNSHPVMACQRCHVIANQGGEVGPDLSDIGARMTRAQLLEATLLPSATNAPGFEMIAITPKQGDVIAGTLVEEDDSRITLKLGDGTTTIVNKTDIAQRETMPSSMPQIYDQVLTKTEIRDLIEFLARNTKPPGPPTGPRALKRSPFSTNAAQSDEG